MSFHPQMPYGSGWHKSERRFAEAGAAVRVHGREPRAFR